MDPLSDLPERRPSPVAGTLLGGACVGALVATLQAWSLLPELRSLPGGTGGRFLLLSLAAYAGSGLLAAAPGLFQRRLWAPALAVGLFVFLELLPRLATAGPAGGALIALAAAAVVTAALGRWALDRRWAARAGSWALAALASLAALLVALRVAPNFSHGGPWSAALGLALPLLALAAVAAFRWTPRSLRLLPWGAALAGLIAALPLGTGAGPAADSEQPNVLLITIDTLRADHLGCYGNPTVRTPRLDALAAEGVLFEDAISPMPVTSPAHASILTGLYPGNHGVTDNGPFRLAATVPSLADLLADRGYATAAFVSGGTLKRNLSPLHQRFQLFDDDLSPSPVAPDTLLRTSLAQLFYPDPEDRARGFTERLGERTLAAARGWLDRNRGRRFLLWVHFFDPHGPYRAPAPYGRMYDDYDGEPVGLWPSMDAETKKEVASDPLKLRHLRARYAGEVSYVDAQIGALLDALSAAGLDDRTIVALTADHGESLTENGHFFGHQHCLYDTALRVPLLLRFPDGRAAGRRVGGVAELVDVAPTLLEAMRLPLPERLDGRSLMPQVHGELPDTERLALSAVLFNRRSGSLSALSVRGVAHKLLRQGASLQGIRIHPPREEFYDLSDDPAESRDIAGERPEIERPFRRQADLWWNLWVLGADPDASTLTPEERERLKSLGYI